MSANPGPHWLDADDSTGHAKHADAPASRETAGQGPLPQLSEDGIDLQGRRTAAFKRYLDQLFPQPLEAETRASALEPFEALQRYLQLDRRMLALMPRTLPGQADELVVEEARTLCAAYAELLEVEPYGGIYSHQQTRQKMGQCVEYAGRAAESLRDDDRAMAFYREAVPLFHDADALDDVRRLEMKIDEIARHRSSDFDVEIATLRGRLSEEGLSALERAEALISLGELYLRGGDTYAAAAPLQKAEGLLDTRCGGNPGPDALAQAHRLDARLSWTARSTPVAAISSASCRYAVFTPDSTRRFPRPWRGPIANRPNTIIASPRTWIRKRRAKTSEALRPASCLASTQTCSA